MGRESLRDLQFRRDTSSACASKMQILRLRLRMTALTQEREVCIGTSLDKLRPQVSCPRLGDPSAAYDHVSVVEDYRLPWRDGALRLIVVDANVSVR